MNTAYIALLGVTWLILGVVCWLGWQLLRQNGRLLLRLEALEERLNEFEFGESAASADLLIGSPAPEFELPNLAGKTETLAQYRGRALLLVFFNPACGYCRELAPKLAALSSRTRQGNEAVAANSLSEITVPKSNGHVTSAAANELPQLVILTTGDAEKNRELFREHRLDFPVLLQKDAEIATAYQASGTPTGYLISAEGKIASKLAMGAEALLALANGGPHTLAHPRADAGQEVPEGDRGARFRNHSLTRSRLKRDGLSAGTPAPDFRLPRIDGQGELALSELRGQRVLLIFSSPSCGPCNTLAPQLQKFYRQNANNGHPHSPQPSSRGEGERPPAVEVVMISRGEPKENRAKVREHGLTFPVLVQQQWEISRRYAMFATPIAYLIDEHGVIAADVAVGSDAILDLLYSVEKRTSIQTGIVIDELMFP